MREKSDITDTKKWGSETTRNGWFFIEQGSKLKNTESWNLRQQFLETIKQKGGWVNCHAHMDKAFYISRQRLQKAGLDMAQKWRMSDDTKKKDTQEDVEHRIRKVLDIMIAQGARHAATFIDAYEAMGHRAIDAALKVRKLYKDKITLTLISHPLGGLLDKKSQRLYMEITEKADIAGGLPSYDRPYDAKNFDILFSIARHLNKPLHIHIDQENNPHERDSEKLVYYTKKYKYEHRVTAIHVISLSSQSESYRKKIYRQFAKLGISVIVCPSAAINMRQLENYEAPVHNSIANVPEMLEAGVLVGLGVDNICDFYNPFGDADLWFESRLLMDACRYYDFDRMIDICTENGKKILEIK
ncbi:MAG: amidohydrolase family protein [Candidatus Magasanikbacteria bacterium]|nr:amidohydrolase family protein [Candidatus Magasanikbacteria bacterium]